MNTIETFTNTLKDVNKDPLMFTYNATNKVSEITWDCILHALFLEQIGNHIDNPHLELKSSDLRSMKWYMKALKNINPEMLAEKNPLDDGVRKITDRFGNSIELVVSTGENQAPLINKTIQKNWNKFTKNGSFQGEEFDASNDSLPNITQVKEFDSLLKDYSKVA